MDPREVPTTYQYQPLEKGQIRLLQISWRIEPNSGTRVPIYRLIPRYLPPQPHEPALEYEAISYQWGAPLRISGLPIDMSEEPEPDSEPNPPPTPTIGLTKNLTEALSCLLTHSTTNLLWIDQLCINQGTSPTALTERSVQVSQMSKIYTLATRVLVWTGPADTHSSNCREYLDGLASWISTYPDRERIIPGSQTYNPDRRYVLVRSTFSRTAPTDGKFAPSILRFWARPWFTRGWIVQEFLLAREILVIAGQTTFSAQDLFDMHAVPVAAGQAETVRRSHLLMNMRLRPFGEHQPLRFLRIMHEVAGRFDTQFLCDALYACLGLLGASHNAFEPDFEASVRSNFTRFAASLAEGYGSLDFLSMWSANLDEVLTATPQELRGFPSWVPSWSMWPLQAPFRLAVGGVRMLGYKVQWDACGGRRHVFQLPDGSGAYKGSVAVTDRLVVRGRVIDTVDRIAGDAVFNRYWDFKSEMVEADHAYLDDLVAKIQKALKGLDHWTRRDMLRFLSVVAANGAEWVEDTETTFPWKEYNDLVDCDQALGLCLSVGRGRRFMRTKGGKAGEEGRLGLAPAFGTKVGSLIVVLHGCSVPIVLECADEELGEYKVVGDCYVEGVMLGEAVEGWRVEEAQTFVLV
ncbi:hypothetical protein LEMA_P044230.1 [Plenodomus lingam JN3]|uniref:Heterokaryon incompatibility domain-containing protein n=1 Tax=Leptosphaeria maculans (strain JN3 / isolate v23.1.3 / race Av1-4-5-6-7-8) TaxID=985895 RepID=E4ZPY7_LEPMJ|nr:hypothetical protein LEMA_P044230.1 [Plenodomus lingam JN3]CBX93522.1 hypothetical protein LEMA_P044230.1 [Plenodomus lingam JN3]